MPAFQPNLQDESHLKLISVFHYVIGALSLLGIAFLVGHFMLMKFVIDLADEQQKTEAAAVASAAETSPAIETELAVDQELGSQLPKEAVAAPGSGAITPTSQPVEDFPKEIMTIFIIFYVIGGIFFIAYAVLNFLSARFIAQRKHRLFSNIVAGLNCFQFPFGTILGIFTFVVLSRPSVKMQYDASALQA